jgi:hypothetical protein
MNIFIKVAIILYLHAYVLYECTLYLRAHLVASFQLVSVKYIMTIPITDILSSGSTLLG